MKVIKKITAIMLSIMMVLGMSSVVSAAGATTSGTSSTVRGKIKISNAVPGQTYTIYKILDLESYDATDPNNGHYAYKVASGWNGFITGSGEGAAYLKETEGYVNWNGEQTDARKADFAKKALAYAGDNSLGNQGSKVCAQEASTVEFDNLDLGYYLVDSSVGTLCYLNTTNNEVDIEEKNVAPTVKKEVQEDSTNNYDNSNTADIGQTVNFKTTITAQAGAQNYVLHDKMSEGLTFLKSTVKVQRQVGSATPTNVDSGYTVKTDDLGESIPNDCTFHIEFNQTFCNTLQANEKIIITYSASLNKDAVVAGEGNTNTAKLEYGNKNFTTPIITKTKTYEIPVFKYTNKNGTDTALAGAVFELYRDENCTSKIEFINIGKDTTTNYDCYRIKIGSESSSVDQITTSANGKFKISGLDADTYYLKEVTAPKGYNKPLNPTKIRIDSDGNIYVNKSTTANTGDVKVLNKSGSLLPSTGGRGTTLFYILGAILVVGSGVVLITKKRMK